MLYHEDCLKTLSKIQSESIDLIIADPPYFQIYGKFDFGIFENKEDYLNWCQRWLVESSRVLKKDGTVMLWGGAWKKRNYSCSLGNYD